MRSVMKKKNVAGATENSDIIQILELFDIAIAKVLTHNNTSTVADEGKFANKELPQKWNTFFEALFQTNNAAIVQMGNSLCSAAENDVVGDMISTVNTQSESLHMLESTGTALGESISDASENISNIAKYVTISKTKSADSVENIKYSIDIVKKSLHEIVDINAQLNKFKERTQEITKVIEIVHSIASQTNLLSLNAAIEAARAGQQGKGFAVVADEVRKLADHTQHSVTEIQKNISGLTSDIDKFTARMSSASEQLISGQRLVEDSIRSVNDINDAIGEIDDTVNQIAAGMEQQSTSMTAFASGVTELAKTGSQLVEYCYDTGNMLFKANKLMDVERGKLVRFSSALTTKQRLDIFITDHKVYTWRVYNMILGYEQLEVSTMYNHKTCRFGTWCYSITDPKVLNSAAYQKAEQSHANLHKIAVQAIEAYLNKDIDKARQQYDQMKPYLKDMEQSLEAMKALF